MGFRRVMHDRVMPRHQPVQQLRVADVAVHELHTITQNAPDVLQIARIRQRIQHRHMNVGMIVVHVMHEIRSDETTATGHNDVTRSKHFISHTGNHSVAAVRDLMARIQFVSATLRSSD